MKNKSENKPDNPEQVINNSGGGVIKGVFMAILKVPTWAIVIITLAIFSVSATLAYQYYQNRTRPMGGELNIVVIPFEEKGIFGYYQSNLGERVAQIFYDQLNATGEFSSISNLSIQIRGPQEVSSLSGMDSDDLAISAGNRSEKLNAQIVIYGFINYDNLGEPVVNVRFYISPNNFGEAQELIGSEMLGELDLGSFTITGDTVSGVDLKAQNKQLRDRLDIFALLIKTLGTYVGEDYDLSQQYIEQAMSDSLWSNTSGLEVIYLTAGNISLRNAQALLPTGQGTLAYQSANQARTYYLKADEITRAAGKGTYARSFLGLAGLESFYVTSDASLTDQPEDINLDALRSEESYLQQALDANYQPATADVQEKVYYSRAQIALTYYLYYRQENQEWEDSLQKAEENYQLVIDAYDRGNDRLVEYSAFSHSGLAIVARIRGDSTAAVQEYLKAFSISRIPSFKSLILMHIGNTYYEIGDYPNALKYYQDAISRKIDLSKKISNEQIDVIESRIVELQSKIDIGRTQP